MRAGLGQVGVITRATLSFVPAPQQVRRFLLFYSSLGGMLRDARLLADDDRFDAVQGAILGAPTGGLAFRLDVAKFFTGTAPDDATRLAGLTDDPARRQPTTLAYADYVNRLAMLESTLRANGQWFFPHPWLTTFVGDSRVEAVVDDELRRLHPSTDLGRFGQIVVSPIRRSAISSPLLQLPSDDLCFAFNLMRVPATADIDNARRLVDANRATYERVRSAGGRSTRSAPSRCRATTGAATSARSSTGWSRQSGATTRATCSPRAMRSSDRSPTRARARCRGVPRG